MQVKYKFNQRCPTQSPKLTIKLGYHCPVAPQKRHLLSGLNTYICRSQYYINNTYAYLHQMCLYIMKRYIKLDVQRSVLPRVKHSIFPVHSGYVSKRGGFLVRLKYFLIICELLVNSEVIFLQIV